MLNLIGYWGIDYYHELAWLALGISSAVFAYLAFQIAAIEKRLIEKGQARPVLSPLRFERSILLLVIIAAAFYFTASSHFLALGK